MDLAMRDNANLHGSTQYLGTDSVTDIESFVAELLE